MRANSRIQKCTKYQVLWLLFVTITTQATSINVNDYANRSVTLQQTAERVIALSPHIVENMFSIGAGSLLVGVVDHSDFPHQAKQITRIGGASSFSLEKILSLSPDLVIVWASAAKNSIVEKLTSLGIPVYVDNPRTLVDIARSIRDFGLLTGQIEKSITVANNYLLEVQSLRNQYQRVDDITVLYEVWNNPLQTINRKHIISDIITLCGGKNVFGDTLSLAPKVNIEAVINRNPDIIVSSNTSNQQQWLDYWLAWPVLRAVRHRRLYVIDPDLIQRHTVRILTGTKILCDYINETLLTERQR